MRAFMYVVYSQGIRRRKMILEVFMRIVVCILNIICARHAYAHQVHIMCNKNDNKRTYLVVILLTIGGLFCGGVSGPSLYYIACHCSICMDVK